MNFNIISNISNGVGLERDYHLLRDELVSLGHAVAGISFRATDSRCRADVNIFLEIVAPQMFSLARRQWLVPNPEWFFQRACISAFEKVLVKTKDAEGIFSGLSNAETKYMGWMSRDLYDPNIGKQEAFIHVAGKSQFKNTAAVIECWTKYRIPAQLYLISENFTGKGAKNVTCLKRATDEELKTLMNMCQFHLMPSAAEGYGHALHEAFGVRSVVMTTNAAPMNECPAPVLVQPTGHKPNNLGALHYVTPESVYESVNHALRMDADERWCAGLDARAYFENENRGFSERLKSLVGEA